MCRLLLVSEADGDLMGLACRQASGWMFHCPASLRLTSSHSFGGTGTTARLNTRRKILTTRQVRPDS
ncbi:unnamed protein product [Protopolystoma xenopodis]|uniref:Uncharacterized protein n=1 Tax=Protopolystoma xenopodis TaxID=117903 RepID=A0A448WS60_9PLAT|nr:unnamed protein product [Protopolystoma xenopodis]